jgi:Protein of unknown function (DUF2630)
MEDDALIHRIGALVDEEHELEKQIAAAPDTPEATDRLKELEVQLDQCWDLLRQRRAKREYGENPDTAQARSSDTVEGYLG